MHDLRTGLLLWLLHTPTGTATRFRNKDNQERNATIDSQKGTFSPQPHCSDVLRRRVPSTTRYTVPPRMLHHLTTTDKIDHLVVTMATCNPQKHSSNQATRLPPCPRLPASPEQLAVLFSVAIFECRRQCRRQRRGCWCVVERTTTQRRQPTNERTNERTKRTNERSERTKERTNEGTTLSQPALTRSSVLGGCVHILYTSTCTPTHSLYYILTQSMYTEMYNLCTMYRRRRTVTHSLDSE